MGLTRDALRYRVSVGDVDLRTPRVLVFPSAPRTYKQDLMVSVLDSGPGAVASFEAGAAVWGVPGFWSSALDVIRVRRRQRGAIVHGELHETKYLPPHHVTEVDGIPVTTLARMIFDLAGVAGFSAARVEAALEYIIHVTPSTLEVIRGMLGELGTRGRPGVTLMRALLDERPPGYVPAESGLELRAKHILDDAGIETVRQVTFRNDEQVLGRVDLRIVGEPAAVEADSALHHTSVRDRERDERRDALFARHGLHIIRITDEQVFLRPWVVPSEVRGGILHARRLQAAGLLPRRSGATAPDL